MTPPLFLRRFWNPLRVSHDSIFFFFFKSPVWQREEKVSKFFPLKLRWEATAQLLPLSSTHVCFCSEREKSWHACFPSGSSPARHFRARPPSRGSADVRHTYTPHLNKNARALQGFVMPQFSLYQDVWISLCMELLWLLVDPVAPRGKGES